MISLQNVTVTYGRTAPLTEVSLDIPTGATVAVMGPSGSGKSTLMRLIAGIQRPSSGSVSIDGERVAVGSWNTASDPRVSLVYQDYKLVPFLTVSENMQFAAELRGVRLASKDIHDALGQVSLKTSMFDRLPESLSGGEQQRVAIARCLAVQTPVLLADEPTGALDQKNTDQVTETLVQLSAHKSLTILVATHDEGVARRLQSRLSFQEGMLSW